MAQRDINTVDVQGDINQLKGEGVQVGDTKYEYGADLSTDGVPLIDPGVGKTVSIRVFHFKMDPSKIKHFPNDKQAIFNSHAQQMRTILWGDGLVPLEGVGPRVIINTKSHSYDIFIPCEARLNTIFVDRPKNLSEELLKGKLEKPKAH
jgi:hypothetical protein